MIENATRVSTLARQNSFVEASFKAACNGVAGGDSPAPMLLVATFAPKQAVYVSSLFWIERLPVQTKK